MSVLTSLLNNSILSLMSFFKLRTFETVAISFSSEFSMSGTGAYAWTPSSDDLIPSLYFPLSTDNSDTWDAEFALIFKDAKFFKDWVSFPSLSVSVKSVWFNSTVTDLVFSKSVDVRSFVTVSVLNFETFKEPEK